MDDLEQQAQQLRETLEELLGNAGMNSAGLFGDDDRLSDPAALLVAAQTREGGELTEWEQRNVAIVIAFLERQKQFDNT